MTSRSSIARRLARITAAGAIALALASACTPDPTIPGTPAPVIISYGGENFEYRGDVPYSSEYVESKYDLWVPVAGAPERPLVIFIHGGYWVTTTPPNNDANRKNLPPSIMALLSHGYAIASLDYRGVMQNCAGGVPCSQNEILSDIKGEIGQLYYNAAPDRLLNEVHLIGFSAGGHLAMMAGMTHLSDAHPANGSLNVKPNSITSLAGPTDLAAMWNANSAGPLGRAVIERYSAVYGSAPDNARVSPIGQLGVDPNGAVDPPLNLLYSTDDEVVPYAHGVALKNAAQAAGISVTFTTLTGVDHTGMAYVADTNTLAAWLDAH